MVTGDKETVVRAMPALLEWQERLGEYLDHRLSLEDAEKVRMLEKVLDDAKNSYFTLDQAAREGLEADLEWAKKGIQ